MTENHNESNFFGLFRSLGETPYVALTKASGVESAVPTDSPWPRCIFRAAPGELTSDRLAAKTADAIRRGEHPDLWIVSPNNAPEDLAQALTDHGFSQSVAWPAMRLEPSRFAGKYGPAALPVSELPGRSSLARFAEIVLRRQPGDAGAEAFARMFENARDRNPDAFRFFIGQAAGRAVAASMLFIRGGTAGIYWVATLPEHRRAGFGTAVTARAAAEAFDSGAARCVLHATSMGEAIYRRLGFETVFTYRGYSLAGAATSASQKAAP